uniref:NB-ARC domain-containing protein n=2 Tax=Glycine max TaxID=3847 RepID=K7L654_SOYBN
MLMETSHARNRRNHSRTIAGGAVARRSSTMLLETSRCRTSRLQKNLSECGDFSSRHGSLMPPESTSIILKEIMTALTQPNIGLLGLYGSSNANKENVVEKVTRRVERDGLFNVVVKTCVMKKPDLKRIQGELGNALGLQLHEKTLKERATRLCERVKMEDKILIILHDLHGQINLAKIGIPFGNDHKGCKILLVTENKEVLSHKMKTQIEFSVDEEPSSSGLIY